MKYAAILPLLALLSCSKQQHQPPAEMARAQESTLPKVVGCNFSIHQFNQTQRPQAVMTGIDKKKPVLTPPASSVVPNATIYIDFDGHQVANTYWNTNGNFEAAPANLVPTEQEKIVHRVYEDFAPFNVTITTDEAVFLKTDPYKRMRVVVTETWQWYGLAGGVAYPQSFQWGNNTPCFVFSTLLSYNEKWIAEAVSHEVGHTLGLQHQASFANNCSLLTEFHPGNGSGTFGWAPIMGSSYMANVTTWYKGRTAGGCQTVQDDVAIIGSVLGLKTDESDGSKKEEMMAVQEGVINNSNDVDRFYVELKREGNLVALPTCVDNCNGANMNLQLTVYRKNGQLVTTAANPASLSPTTRLPAGKYYVDVQTKATAFQDRYGMLGVYHLMVQP